MPHDESKNCFNFYNCWLDDFKQNFLKAANVMTQDEILEEAGKWDKLVADNKPLRVDSPNGIISVEEDYFDKFLIEHIPNGEFKMAALIGEALAEYKISDSFIHQRVCKLIDDGILEITGHYNTRSEYYDANYYCYLRRVVVGEERQKLLNCKCKDNKIIDIFANDNNSLRSFLAAKTVEEKYEDLRFTMTEHTPKGSRIIEKVIPADKIKELSRERRENLFNKFIDNKYFDAPLVDKILSFKSTKNALIMPFFSMLGYDVFDTIDFTPEFTCDVAAKKGEKIDYAIMKDGEPTMLIECKKAGMKLQKQQQAQLFRYFSTNRCRIAILTNGIIYHFFSDLNAPNIMDDEPFLSFNLLEDDSTIYRSSVQQFQKETFDVKNVISKAVFQKYDRLDRTHLPELPKDYEGRRVGTFIQ